LEGQPFIRERVTLDARMQRIYRFALGVVSVAARVNTERCNEGSARLQHANSTRRLDLRMLEGRHECLELSLGEPHLAGGGRLPPGPQYARHSLGLAFSMSTFCRELQNFIGVQATLPSVAMLLLLLIFLVFIPVMLPNLLPHEEDELND
jgi:hypothetical protein